MVLAVLFLFMFAGFFSEIFAASSMLTVGSSLVQAGSKAGSFLNNSLLTPVSPATDIGTAILQTAVQQQTSKVGIDLQDVQNMASVLSILNFFKSLPDNFVQQQQGWDYSNSEILVENKNFDTKTGDLTSITRLRCDLQFKSSGDVNSPLGYLVRDGKYYFTPGQNLFEVQNNTNGITEVKNLLSSSFRNSILSFVGLVDSGSVGPVVGTISTFFDRAPFLYPQDIFVVKLLQLFNTASRNSKNGSSYPRVAHIPLEAMLLLKRLSITPNYDLTMKNHDPKVSYAYQWALDKVVYFQGPLEALNGSIVNVNSSFLKAVTSSIKVNVSQQDWDAFQSCTMPTNDGLKLKKLVASVWTTEGYNNRSANILSNLLANSNFVAYTASEQKLFINTILYHISQRNSGFLLYSQLCQQMQEGPSAIQDQASTHLNPAVLLGVAQGQPLDLGLILTIFSSRTPKIKQIITNTLNSLAKVSSNQFLDSATQYLNDQLAAIEDEKNYYIDVVNNISALKATAASTSLSVSDQLAATKALSNALDLVVKKISEFETASAPEFNQGALIDKSISLQDYLSIKLNDLHEMQDEKFRGDAGYFYDPLPLEGSAATNKTMAIVIRAVEDLQSAGDLFKQDTKTYSMYDVDGLQVDVRGPDVYAQTIAVKEKLSTAAQKKLYDQKQSVITSGTKIVDTKIISAAAQIDDIASSLDRKWTNFCLQYPFERVKKDPSLSQLLQTQTGASGISQAINTLGSAIAASGTTTTKPVDSLLAKYSSVAGTQGQTLFDDAGKIVQENSFFGANVGTLLAQKIAINYLAEIKARILDSRFSTFITNKISEVQSSLSSLTQQLDAIQTSINTTQQIITTNSQSASTDDVALAGSRQTLSQLQVQKTSLQANIANLTARLTSVNQQAAAISFLGGWFSACETKINKMSVASSQGLMQRLKDLGAVPSDIVLEIAALAGFSTDVLRAAEQFAGDIYSGMTTGFTNVVTVMVLSNTAVTISVQNAKSVAQIATLKRDANDKINSGLLTDVIIGKLDVLKTITTRAQLDAVLALPGGLNSSSQDVTAALAPRAATTSQVPSTATTPIVAGTGIPPQFGSYDPAYPKTVLRFLAEEFCDLTLRSKTFADYGSALSDTVLMSLFGYNLNSLLAVMQTKQIELMQKEITELSTYSINGSEDSPIPQAILDKIKSQANASELSSVDSNLAGVPANILESLSANNTTTAALPPVLNITGATGQAIDNLSGLNISIISPPAATNTTQPYNATVPAVVTSDTASDSSISDVGQSSSSDEPTDTASPVEVPGVINEEGS